MTWSLTSALNDMVSCESVMAVSASPLRASLTVHFRQGHIIDFPFQQRPDGLATFLPQFFRLPERGRAHARLLDLDVRMPASWILMRARLLDLDVRMPASWILMLRQDIIARQADAPYTQTAIGAHLVHALLFGSPSPDLTRLAAPAVGQTTMEVASRLNEVANIGNPPVRHTGVAPMHPMVPFMPQQAAADGVQDGAGPAAAAIGTTHSRHRYRYHSQSAPPCRTRRRSSANYTLNSHPSRARISATWLIEQGKRRATERGAPRRRRRHHPGATVASTPHSLCSRWACSAPTCSS